MQDADFETILADLADRGFAMVPDLLRRDQLEALAREASEGWQGGEFHRAGVGRGAEERPEIRGDHVAWLDPENLTPAQRAYWDFVDQLRQDCNRGLFLGLADFEAHFAVYPPGAFYRRHRDRFQAEGRRTLSCLLYLELRLAALGRRRPAPLSRGRRRAGSAGSTSCPRPAPSSSSAATPSSTRCSRPSASASA